MSDYIYLDHAATTPVDRRVLDECAPYYADVFYNPSSSHVLGQRASAALSLARKRCANGIGCTEDEIVFTSGGTEAVNLAIAGTTTGKRIVVSAIEHESVLSCARSLAESGAEVVTVMPNAAGIITPDALEAVITDDTALVCVMTVNNITGAIQPIKQLAEVAHAHGALLFTDAVQAVCTTDINVKNSGADMLAVSGHKFYSLKGAGFLYARRGIELKPLLIGGGQESGRRAGTENVPAIVAMGKAMELAVCERDMRVKSISGAERAFFDGLEYGNIVRVENRAAGLSSVSFDVDGGRLAVALSLAGLCCSVGSACSAGSATPPSAIVAMGLDHPGNTVRFSFGIGTSAQDGARAAKIVNQTVKKLIK